MLHRLFILLLIAVTTAAGSVERGVFGKLPDGREIQVFTLTNAHGGLMRVITYGAIIADLQVPDRAGRSASVMRTATFSPDNLARFFPQSARVVGRVANRIANAQFTLDGREYRLTPNAAPHNIHSGPVGFDRVLWDAEPASRPDGPAVTLRYFSADGDQGFPGNLRVALTYVLTERNVLRLEYDATTDRPTPVNPTSHGFFNLSGGGPIGAHVLEVNADRYTVVDASKIPTGELRPVAGTPFDFRKPRAVGSMAAAMASEGGRYDHNFVLSRTKDGLSFAARVTDGSSGRVMEVWTTEPGVQVFTSPLSGAPADEFGTICLETQHFPDSVHHPKFPSTILRPGQRFNSVTEYRFATLR